MMDLDELKLLRCPQNWGFSNFDPAQVRLTEKQTEDDECPLETKYASQVRRYRVCCLLSFESYREEKYSEALRQIEGTDDLMDDFMRKYERVFKHVAGAIKAHVLHKLGSTDEAKQIVDKIKGEEYSKVEEACFKYIECFMIMEYGKSGDIMKCVDLIEKALQVVPDEAEFNYNLGKLLGRIRHFKFPAPEPSEKEFNALRKAVSLRRDLPQYSIPLARFYIDSCHFPRYRKNYDCKHAASVIYRNLLEFHNSLTGNDIARCVFNLVKLKSLADLDEYADMALKKSNSTLVNHYIGVFYLRTDEYEKALECLEEASKTLPYTTALVLLLVYRTNGNSIEDEEIEQRAENWMQLFQASDGDYVTLMMNLSQFYLIVRMDLKTAAEYFNNAYERGITERPSVNICPDYINYLSVLKRELMTSRLKDEVVSKAMRLMSKLPTELTSTRGSRSQVMSVSDLRSKLF